MSEAPQYILLVEDEADHIKLIRRAFELANNPARLRVVRTLAEALRVLDEDGADSLPDLIIADWRLPDGDSLALMALAVDRHAIPVVLMTSHGNERLAVEAMHQGALDYVVKSEHTLLDMPQIAGRALCQWQHVVERRRAEAALNESEWRYRLITEHATDTIVLVDHAGRFVYLSPSVERTLGYAAAALVGSLLFDYIHAQDLLAVQDFWNQLPVQEQARIAYRFRHVDGSWRWLDTQGSIFSQDSETYAVLVGRDITERRQFEEQLVQSRGQCA